MAFRGFLLHPSQSSKPSLSCAHLQIKVLALLNSQWRFKRAMSRLWDVSGTGAQLAFCAERVLGLPFGDTDLTFLVSIAFHPLLALSLSHSVHFAQFAAMRHAMVLRSLGSQ